jgi:hypothetical protein
VRLLAPILYRALRNRMFTRICAGVLIVLAVSPFTAPFATCDVVELLHQHAVPTRTPLLQTVVVRAGADAEALVVPTLMTRANLVQVSLVSTMDSVSAASSLSFVPGASSRAPGPDLVVQRAPPRTASVLRV